MSAREPHNTTSGGAEVAPEAPQAPKRDRDDASSDPEEGTPYSAPRTNKRRRGRPRKKPPPPNYDPLRLVGPKQERKKLFWRMSHAIAFVEWAVARRKERARARLSKLVGTAIPTPEHELIPGEVHMPSVAWFYSVIPNHESVLGVQICPLPSLGKDTRVPVDFYVPHLVPLSLRHTYSWFNFRGDRLPTSEENALAAWVEAGLDIGTINLDSLRTQLAQLHSEIDAACTKDDLTGDNDDILVYNNGGKNGEDAGDNSDATIDSDTTPDRATPKAATANDDNKGPQESRLFDPVVPRSGTAPPARVVPREPDVEQQGFYVDLPPEMEADFAVFDMENPLSSAARSPGPADDWLSSLLSGPIAPSAEAAPAALSAPPALGVTNHLESVVLPHDADIRAKEGPHREANEAMIRFVKMWQADNGLADEPIPAVAAVAAPATVSVPEASNAQAPSVPTAVPVQETQSVEVAVSANVPVLEGDAVLSAKPAPVDVPIVEGNVKVPAVAGAPVSDHVGMPAPADGPISEFNAKMRTPAPAGAPEPIPEGNVDVPAEADIPLPDDVWWNGAMPALEWNAQMPAATGVPGPDHMGMLTPAAVPNQQWDAEVPETAGVPIPQAPPAPPAPAPEQQVNMLVPANVSVADWGWNAEMPQAAANAPVPDFAWWNADVPAAGFVPPPEWHWTANIPAQAGMPVPNHVGMPPPAPGPPNQQWNGIPAIPNYRGTPINYPASSQQQQQHVPNLDPQLLGISKDNFSASFQPQGAMWNNMVQQPPPQGAGGGGQAWNGGGFPNWAPPNDGGAPRQL